jgi:hypothetical protein
MENGKRKTENEEGVSVFRFPFSIFRYFRAGFCFGVWM